ncbi:aldehyde dehydrogenase family protein [Pseudomonas aeruginosa]|nr:aldehyde dehydrogenase family protein [Pseudomonas aeruginosa]
MHKVPLADGKTLQKAIDAAKAAFPAWRNTPPAKRAQVLYRFKQLLEQNEARISKLISEEHGKATWRDRRRRTQAAASRTSSTPAPPRQSSRASTAAATSARTSTPGATSSQPIGVVAGITP